MINGSKALIYLTLLHFLLRYLQEYSKICLFKSVPLANGEKILVIVMGFVGTFEQYDLVYL